MRIQTASQRTGWLLWSILGLRSGQYYTTQGFGVVEVAWASPWEAIWFPWPISTFPIPGNIQNAACRPATFLSYVYSSIYTPIATGANGNASAGMCAQGFSAGSAAIAYSLAYYGAGKYLDNVELISGPVLSDIKQGCQVPQAPPVTICPPGQYGCKLGTDAPWTLPPTYVPNGANYVGAWTDDGSCTAAGGTSAASNAQWLAQSIVDQSNITGAGRNPDLQLSKYRDDGMALQQPGESAVRLQRIGVQLQLLSEQFKLAGGTLLRASGLASSPSALCGVLGR